MSLKGIVCCLGWLFTWSNIYATTSAQNDMMRNFCMRFFDDANSIIHFPQRKTLNDEERAYHTLFSRIERFGKRYYNWRQPQERVTTLSSNPSGLRIPLIVDDFFHIIQPDYEQIVETLTRLADNDSVISTNPMWKFPTLAIFRPDPGELPFSEKFPPDINKHYLFKEILRAYSLISAAQGNFASPSEATEELYTNLRAASIFFSLDPNLLLQYIDGAHYSENAAEDTEIAAALRVMFVGRMLDLTPNFGLSLEAIHHFVSLLRHPDFKEYGVRHGAAINLLFELSVSGRFATPAARRLIYDQVKQVFTHDETLYYDPTARLLRMSLNPEESLHPDVLSQINQLQHLRHTWQTIYNTGENP